MKKVVCLLLLSALVTVTHAQKFTLDDATKLIMEKKYGEAHVMMNNKKYRLQKGQEDNHNYLYAFTNMQLYNANPVINSDFRNDALKFAKLVLDSKDATQHSRAREIIKFLTSTLLNDIVPAINADPENIGEMFREFSTETLRYFYLVTVPEEWTKEVLYHIGSCFYNKGAMIKNDADKTTDNEMYKAKADRMRVMMAIAGTFLGVLCDKHNENCAEAKRAKAIGGSN